MQNTNVSVQSAYIDTFLKEQEKTEGRKILRQFKVVSQKQKINFLIYIYIVNQFMEQTHTHTHTSLCMQCGISENKQKGNYKSILEENKKQKQTKKNLPNNPL